MPTNDFLAFATAADATVLSQADYLSDPEIPTGFAVGIAYPEKANKVWRQSSFAVSAIAQFMLEELTVDIADDGNRANFTTQFRQAIQAAAGTGGGGAGIPEAPSTGLAYGRDNAAWTPVVIRAGDTMGGALAFAAAIATGPPDVAGTGNRLVLYPMSGVPDYAIGMATGQLWFGVTGAGANFAWYGGTQVAAQLTGAGVLNLLGNPAGTAALQNNLPGLNATAVDNQGTGVNLIAYGTVAPQLVGQRASGTGVSPSAPASGQNLLAIRAGGYDGAGWFNEAAGIRFQTAENWAPGHRGSAIRFYTTPNGGTAFTLGASLDNAGNWSATGKSIAGLDPTDPTDLVTLRYLQSTRPRQVLTANKTYYVSTTGDDHNDGSASDNAHAWLTLQHAYDWIAANLDLAGFVVTIQMQPGTYTAGLEAFGAPTGGTQQHPVIILGNTATPSSVIINVANGNNCIDALATQVGLTVRGIRLLCSTVGSGGTGLGASYGGSIQFDHMDFGQCDQDQCYAAAGGTIVAAGPYTISGNATSHGNAAGGTFQMSSQGAPIAVTLSGSPHFSTGFVTATGGTVAAPANTFPGSVASGRKYLANLNGIINTQGHSGGTEYFPGDANSGIPGPGGASTTGGQYA